MGRDFVEVIMTIEERFGMTITSDNFDLMGKGNDSVKYSIGMNGKGTWHS